MAKKKSTKSGKSTTAETKPRRKAIKAKFVKKEMEVQFSGLDLDHDEELPKELYDVLDKYGFDFDDCDFKCSDIVAPDLYDLDATLEQLERFFSFDVSCVVKRTKKETKCSYTAQFDVAKPGKGPRIMDALQTAFLAWNKAGRPIEGVPLDDVLPSVVEKINSKRK